MPTAPAHHPDPAPAAVEEIATKEPSEGDVDGVSPTAVQPSAAAANDQGQPTANVPPLEEAMAALIRPMVYQWLDENMPSLIEEVIAGKPDEQT